MDTSTVHKGIHLLLFRKTDYGFKWHWMLNKSTLVQMPVEDSVATGTGVRWLGTGVVWYKIRCLLLLLQILSIHLVMTAGVSWNVAPDRPCYPMCPSPHYLGSNAKTWWIWWNFHLCCHGRFFNHAILLHGCYSYKPQSQPLTSVLPIWA